MLAFLGNGDAQPGTAYSRSWKQESSTFVGKLKPDGGFTDMSSMYTQGSPRGVV